mmetsp:Transcript_2240/g.5045  ORF Transcript_2240/g.5045 Transcript_2240/m.5045 type:complete len:354 (-) Transcript_2240:299-1360(-)
MWCRSSPERLSLKADSARLLIRAPRAANEAHIVNLVVRVRDIGMPRAQKLSLPCSSSCFLCSLVAKSDLYTSDCDAFCATTCSHSRVRFDAELSPPGSTALALPRGGAPPQELLRAADEAVKVAVAGGAAAMEDSSDPAAALDKDVAGMAAGGGAGPLRLASLRAALRAAARSRSSSLCSSVPLRMSTSSSAHGTSVTGHLLPPICLKARSETMYFDARRYTNGWRPLKGMAATGQWKGTSTSAASAPALKSAPGFACGLGVRMASATSFRLLTCERCAGSDFDRRPSISASLLHRYPASVTTIGARSGSVDAAQSVHWSSRSVSPVILSFHCFVHDFPDRPISLGVIHFCSA